MFQRWPHFIFYQESGCVFGKGPSFGQTKPEGLCERVKEMSL